MERRRLAPRRDDATHGSDRVDSIRSKKRATRQRTNEWNDCFLSSGIEKSKGAGGGDTSFLDLAYTTP